MGKTYRANKSRWNDGMGKTYTPKPKKKDDLQRERRKKRQQQDDTNFDPFDTFDPDES